MGLYPPSVGVPVADVVSVPIVEAVHTHSEAVQIPIAEAVQADAKQPTLQSVVQKYGIPSGLASEMQKSSAAFPLRIWIVDDSYSMQTGDGSVLVSGKMIRTTRAKELAQTIVVQAEVAAAFNAKIQFETLNGPSHSIDGSDANQLAAVRAYYDKKAGHELLGSTPLTEAVQRVIGTITPMADSLRATGQRVLVVLATDGHPNHAQSFLQAMRQLQQLPVLVFIRLCTSDDGVAQYWNDLDKELERPLDVLDDVAGEAAECAKVNPWLHYSPTLQVAREFGLSHKLFDLLDEQPLLPTQAAELLELIFGSTMPEPEVDFAAFMSEVARLCQDSGSVFYPPARRAMPWVDMNKVGGALAPRERVRLQLGGEKLKKMDLFSESDPFVIVRDAVSGAMLYNSEHIDNDPNPSWRAFELALVVADRQHATQLDVLVYDHNEWTEHKLIGEVRVGSDELIHGKASRLELKKDGKGSRGFLVVGSAGRA